ncbi:hypothetical protein Nmel_000641 [Mimus melanotis]
MDLQQPKEAEAIKIGLKPK